MIIQTPETSVQTSGKMRTAGFNMKASAKGFHIISTTLYKDPILAIVRELVCNAWDAHQMNKNLNVNVQVHLPTKLEPWFSVKDFGCGMSDDDIFGVYTTVFDSTKDDSNDVIGAMGLGSKTPFSYNNGQSFSVKSVKDGLKAVYSAYLDNGEPAITCMIEPHATTEPDGVEVIVPVNESDFQRFEAAANNVLPYFTSPAVESNIELRKREFVYQDGFFSEERASHYHNTSIYAVMGNVVYPISSSHIDDIERTCSFFKSQSMYVQFDIGELNVSASREELHYDDWTTGNINTRVKTMNDRFIEGAQQWVDDQNFDHASDAYRGTTARYNSNVYSHLLYNDEPITKYANDLLRSSEKIHGSRGVQMRPECSNKEGVRRSEFRIRPNDVLDPNRDYMQRPILIIEDDLKVGGVAIMKEYIRKERKVVWYYHRDKFNTHMPMKLIRERLRIGEYNILKTSDLKENYTPPKKVRKNVDVELKKPVNCWKILVDENGSYSVDQTNVTPQMMREDEFFFVSQYRDGFERKLRDERCGDYHSDLSAIALGMHLKGVSECYIVRRPMLIHVDKNDKAQHMLEVKFNKRELRSKIDWDAYTIHKKTYGWRPELSDAWNNIEVRKHFKMYSEQCHGSIDGMRRMYSGDVHSIVRNEQFDKSTERLKSIQEKPKYKLLFELVDSCTNRDTTKDLIKILRGRRNG